MAQRGYVINNANAGSMQACSSTFKTGALYRAPVSSTMKRFMLWELEFSCLGALNTTTDDQVVGDLSFQGGTAAGTSGGSTIQSTDTNGTTNVDTPVGAGNVNFTAEPTTYSNSFFQKAVNQRSGYTYQVQQGGEIVYPALASTAGNGPGLRFKSSGSYTGTVACRINGSEI